MFEHVQNPLFAFILFTVDTIFYAFTHLNSHMIYIMTFLLWIRIFWYFQISLEIIPEIILNCSKISFNKRFSNSLFLGIYNPKPVLHEIWGCLWKSHFQHFCHGSGSEEFFYFETPGRIIKIAFQRSSSLGTNGGIHLDRSGSSLAYPHWFFISRPRQNFQNRLQHWVVKLFDARQHCSPWHSLKHYRPT